MLRSLLKLLRYFSFFIATIFVLSFVLPFNPDEMYNVGSDSGSIVKSEISFNNIDNVKKHESSDIGVSEKTKVEIGVSEKTKEVDVSEKTKAEKKMFVMLVTGFRTGSTFLGELFNQNPNVLYLFEPLHQSFMGGLMRKNAIHKINKDSDPSLLEQRTAYLDQIVNDCQVVGHMFGTGMSEMMQCGETPEENLIRFGSPECDQSESRWDRACNRREIVALKLIRLQRIEHLELVPGIKDANVYVIHMLRDPRGTMNSRIGFGTFYLDDIENLKVKPLTPEKMGIAAANLCDREWENIQYTINLPDWLKGRFLRVTHDELSMDPMETAKKVYKFISKKVPDSMEEILLQHTTENEKGPLNTHRNSTEVLAKWKSKLELPIIRAIEDKCKNVMDYMGYKPYDPNA